jgi:hypothetical protein
MLLCAAVVGAGEQRIPQLLATDRKAVLQAVGSRSETSMHPVTREATQVFLFAAQALSAVATVASRLLPNTGNGAAACEPSEACLSETTRLLALLTFIHCQATLLQDRTASTAASTGSTVSSGSGGSSGGGAPSSSRQAGASAGQAVTLRHLRAAHKALSACYTALLQLLGVSSEAAVWFAAMFTGSTSEVALRARRLLQALKASTAAAQQQVLAQQQLNQQLLLLVPTMLLRWAAQASGNPAGPSGVPSGLEAVFAAAAAALGTSRLVGRDGDINDTLATATDYVQGWQQHIAIHRLAGANSSIADSAVGADSSMWLQPHLPAEWLQQVFPDIHTICAAGVMGACLDSWSLLVRYQAELIAWAVDTSSQSDVTAAGTQPGPEVGGSTGSSSSTLFETPQPLPAALAAFQGVALQTIASFDSFARSAAQHIAAMQQRATGMLGRAASSITGLCFCREDGSKPGPLLALVQAAGPGSREQQALYSCLRSIVKLATASVAAGGEPDLWVPHIGACCHAAADAHSS